MNLPKKGGAVAVLVFGVIFLLIRIERDKIQEMRRLMLPELSVLCFWASEFSHLAEPSPGTCLYLPKKYWLITEEIIAGFQTRILCAFHQMRLWVSDFRPIKIIKEFYWRWQEEILVFAYFFKTYNAEVIRYTFLKLRENQATMRETETQAEQKLSEDVFGIWFQ